MRDDLLCEVRGRVIDSHGDPMAEQTVEFLPSMPWFLKDGVTLCPIGSKQVTDENGNFTALLTRTDLTGVQYLTRGALGNYVIILNGPGPHLASKLLKKGKKLAPMTRDS